MRHPDEGRLNDHADGLLGRVAAREIEAHLAECAPCRERVAAIRDLTARLGALPREITPTRDLRPPLPGREGIPRDRSLTGLRAGHWLRAAAVVGLVVAGARIASSPTTAPDAAVDGVAGVVYADTYEEASRALRGVLEARRGEAPEEAAVLVERDLAAVDVAIRELVQARARHPDDPVLARMLDQQYRTRLELLRGAVALLEG